jgi:hypothetical protein
MVDLDKHLVQDIEYKQTFQSIVEYKSQLIIFIIQYMWFITLISRYYFLIK